MQPTSQQNYQAPLPADYLDQIAPHHIRRKQPAFSIRNILIAAILIFIGLSIATAVMSSTPRNTEILAARLIATKEVAEKATNNLRDTKLRAANSNLKLYLTNTLRDIKPLLSKVNVDTAKLSESVVVSEKSDTLESTLEDARLNAVYDRTYAREMSYKLETTMSLMKQNYKETSNSELRKFLSGSYDNLEKIQKSFSDFNAANS